MLRNEASKRLQRTVFIEVGDSNAGYEVRSETNRRGEQRRAARVVVIGAYMHICRRANGSKSVVSV